LKPAQAHSSQDPISKIPNTKRAGGVAQGVGPEFKPWYCKEEKKKSMGWARSMIQVVEHLPSNHKALSSNSSTKKKKKKYQRGTFFNG
jgi:hypothetical protein